MRAQVVNCVCIALFPNSASAVSLFVAADPFVLAFGEIENLCPRAKIARLQVYDLQLGVWLCTHAHAERRPSIKASERRGGVAPSSGGPPPCRSFAARHFARTQ